MTNKNKAAREWVDTWKPANKADTDSYGIVAFSAGDSHGRQSLVRELLEDLRKAEDAICAEDRDDKYYHGFLRAIDLIEDEELRKKLGGER